MKKYTARVKVTREYVIGFESTDDPDQVLKDADTIIQDENFGDDFTDEQVELLDFKEDERR